MNEPCIYSQWENRRTNHQRPINFVVSTLESPSAGGSPASCWWNLGLAPCFLYLIRSSSEVTAVSAIVSQSIFLKERSKNPSHCWLHITLSLKERLWILLSKTKVLCDNTCGKSIWVGLLSADMS